MHIDVDVRSRTPIYEQLILRIKELAFRGDVSPDEKLPSVRQLSVELCINPNTIQKAYAELERLGVIYTVAGKGCFISSDTNSLAKEHIEETQSRLRELISEAKASGMPADRIISLVDGIYGGGKNGD